MKNQLLRNKDVAAGLLFASFGLTGIVLSLRYSLGTTGRMGPGYVPLLIAIGMTSLGVMIAATGVFQVCRQRTSVAGERTTWDPRPLFCVLGGILLFGALIQSAGLILASSALLLCGGYAIKGQRLLEVLLLAVVLIAVAVLVFVYGIGVRIDLLPSIPVSLWN